jgi:hypothetical protein
MANKVRFLISSNLDSASLSVSSTSSGLPVTNLQDKLIRKVYRTGGQYTEYVVFDAAAATAIDMLFIGGLNLTKNATVLWQGHTSDSWGSPALNTTLTIATDTQGNALSYVAHFYSSVKEYRYWRLVVNDGSNATSSLNVGRVMGGRAIEPTRNLREGFALDVIDPSRFRQTAGRQGYANTRSSYRTMSYSVFNVGETQQDELLGIYAEVGQHTALVVALDPETRPQHNTMYCQFMTPLNRRHRVLRQMDIDQIQFEEKN